MNTNSTDFACLVTGFLTDYLPHHRCYSRNTILSYRDTLKLFLRFLKEEKETSPNSFYIKDFKRELVIEFLEWYRNNGAGITAANQRLAAPKEVSFLTVEQMSSLINSPDVNSHTGFRHRVILTLLYDSGCRVQELCDITIADISLGSVATVRLHGKGNKYRTVVIADATAKLVENYLSRYRSYAVGTDFLITNRYHRKIDRDGISYIIKKYVDAIRQKDATFPEHVHCHMFRHSKAMHMLEAGINIVYIRDFLGHEDISTTMVYVRADNRLKNDAINALAPKVTEERDFPDWNKDKDLLQFLNSLK